MALTIPGSVKDTLIHSEPTHFVYGDGEFNFRPDYSVFDWAHGGYEMPDKIPGKDVAQCLTGAYFFEQVEKMGIPTTYICLLRPDTGEVLPRGEPVPTNRMKIRIARVVKPEHMMNGPDGKQVPSYREYREDLRCKVVPVEFIFRFGLPKGSSAFRRMRKGAAKPEFFGLEAVPGTDDPIWFGIPRMDYSTKFDPRGDVYDLGRDWYRYNSGMREMEMRWIDAATMAVAEVMGREYKRIGMDLWDGKLEFVFDPGAHPSERTISLGDVPGPLDEVRVLAGGQQRSKQFVRDVYEKRQPEWVAACRSESERGGEWQQRLIERGLVPKPLAPAELDLASGIYTSTANALWGRNIIPGAPSMEEVDREYRKFLAATNQ